jgi:DNA modification methylase
MPVDLIVTSPPYINAMNYSMATRYELILLGLVKPTDMIAHQEKYFGSERVYAKQYKELNPVPVEWSCSSYLNQLLEEIYHKEPKRSFIAGEYFKKMRSSFENMKPYLKQNGILVIVAGTNTIRQVKIDTFNILVTLLEDIGFSTESRFHYEIIKQVFKITRHETANIIPQDGVAVMRKV